MKLVLLFISICQLTFAQNTNISAFESNVPIDSLIKGDWFLTQEDIIDGYNISDTNKFTSQQPLNHQITITSDSLISYKDISSRYYLNPHNYLYKIEYDSIIHTKYLKLFIGKKKRLVDLESYEIIKCTTNELIIKSYIHLFKGIENSSFSIVYVYRKDKTLDITNKLMIGKWFYYSNKDETFLSESDTSKYEFSHTKNDSLSTIYNSIELEFKQEGYNSLISCYFYNQFSGFFGKIPFEIDENNQLIYLNSKSPVVYDIHSLSTEKLIISVNQDRTKELQAN